MMIDALVAALADATVRVSIVLAIGLMCAWIARRRAASLRHWLLAVSVMIALAAPLASWTAPGIAIGWPVDESAAADPAPRKSRPVGTLEVTTFVASQPGRAAASPRSSLTWRTVVIIVWLAGAILLLARLAAGLARLRTISRTGVLIDDGEWRDAARSLADTYGIRRHIRVIRSDQPALLATWGIRAPVVVVPPDAPTWNPERIRVVLAHELAHVARGDWPAQLLAEALRALYWFHPLAWIAASRLRRESEYACDDRVLSAGTSGRDYAVHLLALARHLGRREPSLPAVAMARASGLQERIAAMLNDRTNHGTVSVRTRAFVFCLGLVLCAPIAVARTTPGAISGEVLDSMRRPAPGATVTVTNRSTGAGSTTTSDGVGRFVFEAMVAGTYDLAVALPGFRKAIVESIQVDGKGISLPAVVLAIGMLSEELTITGSRSADPASAARDRPPAAPFAPTLRPPCTTALVGGDVTEPKKIVDVRPSYPIEIQQQGIEGAVVLEGIVSGDGSVHNLRVLRAVHAQLAEALIDAVERWRYTPTLLNCEPIEVVITVTANFGLRSAR